MSTVLNLLHFLHGNLECNSTAAAISLPSCGLSGGSWSAHARRLFHSPEEGLSTPGQSAPPLHARGHWPW